MDYNSVFCSGNPYENFPPVFSFAAYLLSVNLVYYRLRRTMFLYCFSYTCRLMYMLRSTDDDLGGMDENVCSFAIFGWSNSFHFFEHTAQMLWIVEPQFVCYLCNGKTFG